MCPKVRVGQIAAKNEKKKRKKTLFLQDFFYVFTSENGKHKNCRIFVKTIYKGKLKKQFLSYFLFHTIFYKKIIKKIFHAKFEQKNTLGKVFLWDFHF